jgi:hypothetical protein
VEQDYLRRIVLREHDVEHGANIGLIDQTARYALDNGYDVILDGILFARHYGDMLRGLWTDHAGVTGHYYFDIPLEETLRRHATRALANEVSPDQLRGWYNHRDLLSFVEESIIDATASVEESVERVMREMNWWCGQVVQHSLAQLANPAWHRFLGERVSSGPNSARYSVPVYHQDADVRGRFTPSHSVRLSSPIGPRAPAGRGCVHHLNELQAVARAAKGACSTKT